MKTIVWTEYLKYRTKLRGFNIQKLENILRYSSEKYFDTATDRSIVVGKHEKVLVMIPYEESKIDITPVTVHATSRQQINYRIKSGRLINE